MIEFPKMIYRPRALPNQDLGGSKLDTRVVESVGEEAAAIREGWIVALADALARVDKSDKRTALLAKLRDGYARWEWTLKAMAIFFAIAASGIAFLKVL